MSQYKSRVYTDRPPYADYDAPQKFMAIEAIIAKRLIEHPKAMCSYSGGSDSDIMIDLIERVRKAYGLPSPDYYFINTKFRVTVNGMIIVKGVPIDESLMKFSILAGKRVKA